MLPKQFDEITKKKTKHVDPVVNIIRHFLLDASKALSNTRNYKRSSVDIFRNTSSTSSCVEQNIVTDKISHSYDCKASYTIYSRFFQCRKKSIGNNVIWMFLKDPSNPRNSATNSSIISITTQFVFIDIKTNITPVKKSTQYHYSKYFPDN